MKCIDCNSFLIPSSYKDCDYCQNCGIEKISFQFYEKLLTDFEKNKFIFECKKKQIKCDQQCSRCHQQLNLLMHFSGVDEFKVCTTCNVAWFNKGDLKKVIDIHKPENQHNAKFKFPSQFPNEIQLRAPEYRDSYYENQFEVSIFRSIINWVVFNKAFDGKPVLRIFTALMLLTGIIFAGIYIVKHMPRTRHYYYKNYRGNQ